MAAVVSLQCVLWILLTHQFACCSMSLAAGLHAEILPSSTTTRCVAFHIQLILRKTHENTFPDFCGLI